MTSEDIREEISALRAQIVPLQTKISELAAQLMVVTKEEMQREGIRQTTGVGSG